MILYLNSHPCIRCLLCSIKLGLVSLFCFVLFFSWNDIYYQVLCFCPLSWCFLLSDLGLAQMSTLLLGPLAPSLVQFKREPPEGDADWEGRMPLPCSGAPRGYPVAMTPWPKVSVKVLCRVHKSPKSKVWVCLPQNSALPRPSDFLSISFYSSPSSFLGSKL